MRRFGSFAFNTFGRFVRFSFFAALLSFFICPPFSAAKEVLEEDLGASGNTAGNGTDGILEKPGAEPSKPTAGQVPSSKTASTTQVGEPDSTTGMDIRTSTLAELAAWCRSLELSESGTREELQKRLRTHYGLSDSEGKPSAEDEGRVVVIESAQGSEYFTLETVNEEYARLRGDVVASFKDGTTTHRIRADELLYNRSRNTLSAKGKVVYEKLSGDSTEYFRGDSLTVDVDDWTGVFLDGASEKSKQGQDTAYRFSANLIARVPEGVTILDNATVSTMSEESDPYWTLKASRIWLLPGSEWAIANAVLNVGEVPVLYIPFFYLPGDELIFHPVMGFRQREGNYVQTTTYILGKPKAPPSTELSLIKALEGDSNEEKVQQGIFLRRTGKRATPGTGTSLSLLFDAYANLGWYLGINSSLPKGKLLGKLDTSFGMAISRNVYTLTPDYYTPFPDATGESVWNEARLFDLPVPFRYRFKTTGSIEQPWFSLTWSIPFYSDPYVDQDFLNRSENMDWMNMLKQGAATTDTATIGVLGAYEVNLGGSIKPNIKAFQPYINNLSISNLRSSLSFATKSSKTIFAPSPSRIYFYPSKFTLLSFSSTLSGKPLSLGSTSTAAKAGIAPSVPTGTTGLAGSGMEALRDPWSDPEGFPAEGDGDGEEKGEGKGETTEGGQDPDKGPKAAQTQADPDPKPPALTQKFSPAEIAGSPRFELSYSLTPSIGNDLFFRTEPWLEATDVEWDSFSNELTVLKTSAEISGRAYSPNELLSLGLVLSGNSAWQDNGFINEEAQDYNTEAKRSAVRLRNLTSTYFRTNAALSLVMKPFVPDPVWSASSFEYLLKGRMADSVFSGTTDDPAWKVNYSEWTEDAITAHQGSVKLSASIRDLTQTLQLSGDLPPRPAALNVSTSLRAWISTTTASMKITDPLEDAVFEPITISEKLDFSKTVSLSQQYVFNPKVNELDSATGTLRLGNFSSVFTGRRTQGYRLDSSSGWVVTGDGEQFRPQTLSFAFKRASTIEPLWKNRFNANYDFSSNFSFDFQRYTQSSFNVSFSTSIKLYRFLDLSLSATSANSVIFRYLQDIPFFELPLDVPGEQNPLIDLADSFNFLDENKRMSSGFKLKSLKAGLKHYMGDWTAELSYALTPYLDTGRAIPAYILSNEVSFLVKWIPLPDFKTETKFDRTGFTM